MDINKLKRTDIAVSLVCVGLCLNKNKASKQINDISSGINEVIDKNKSRKISAFLLELSNSSKLIIIEYPSSYHFKPKNQ